MTLHLTSRLIVSAVASCAFQAALAQETIKDYLFNHSAGKVAASDIIELSSAVSTLQTPRDLVIALSALGNRDTEGGFGISVTPGRTALPVVAVAADKYASGDVWRRVWGGTTFSYAQNKKSLGGADYAQMALAVNVTYQLFARDDPIVIAYRAMSGDSGDTCRAALEQLEAAEQSLEAFKRQRVSEEEARLGRELNLAELAAVNASATEQHAAALRKLGELRACAHAAADAVSKKWNASRLQLVLGKGWIRPQAGGQPKLTLAEHITLSLAIPAGADGLVNLTARRVAHELKLNTIATAPEFTTTNGVAGRYTYRASKANDLYGIAEISNLKKSAAPTESNADFRYAIGIDRKLSNNFWLEFRFGRSRVSDSTGLENKALFSLKFSPEATLERQVK
jgi:hypothetical protein